MIGKQVQPPVCSQSVLYASLESAKTQIVLQKHKRKLNSYSFKEIRAFEEEAAELVLRRVVVERKQELALGCFRYLQVALKVNLLDLRNQSNQYNISKNSIVQVCTPSGFAQTRWMLTWPCSTRSDQECTKTCPLLQRRQSWDQPPTTA